jgi:predicted house-cleaning NTP pyrophosphatase (Maf/HAM1 superfamily)
MLSDFKMGSFFVGSISGSVQTLVGHPLDTIKVLLQNNKKIN